MARQTVERFDQEDPFYKLPEEYGGRDYIVYTMADAAYDVLIDNGADPANIEIIREIQLLESAAKRIIRVGKYKKILEQRYDLRDELNQIFHVHPDRG